MRHRKKSEAFHPRKFALSRTFKIAAGDSYRSNSLFVSLLIIFRRGEHQRGFADRRLGNRFERDAFSK